MEFKGSSTHVPTLLAAIALSLLWLRPVLATDCGGGAYPDCGGKEWCEYAADNACGVQGKPGVCRARPQICTFIYLPVCGCDAKTYSNACAAHASGASVAYAGTCRQPFDKAVPVPKAARDPGRVCTQVITCGIKNGKPREYPNPCAAEDDGATHIRPKTGRTCQAAK
jgi:hypothetical protein